MIRLLAPFLLLSIAASQDDAGLRARLERFRQLTPEQKQKFRERVELLKGMSSEDRGRLGENLRRFRELPAADRQRLRDRIEKLPVEERRAMVEIGAGFFRWALQQGYADGFPRDIFFAWLRHGRRPELERLRALEPADRKDAFVRLFYDFKEDRLRQFAAHAARHGCVTEEQLRELRESSIREFWPRLHDLWKGCKSRAPRRSK